MWGPTGSYVQSVQEMGTGIGTSPSLVSASPGHLAPRVPLGHRSGDTVDLLLLGRETQRGDMVHAVLPGVRGQKRQEIPRRGSGCPDSTKRGEP
jgi:hypothetical protein